MIEWTQEGSTEKDLYNERRHIIMRHDRLHVMYVYYTLESVVGPKVELRDIHPPPPNIK